MNGIINFITSIPFLIVAALVTTLTSIDIYMPCMPEMSDYFIASPDELQLSVSMGFLGSSIITPLLGPLSDSIGRRRLLVFGHLLYAINLIACGLSSTIEQFIFFRFVSGFFGASVSVLSFVVIADQYKGFEAAKYFAYLTTAITSSLVIAPLIGGFIADNFDWNVCFFFLSSLAIPVALLMYRFLPETHARTSKFSVRKTFSVYRQILASTRFMSMVLIPSVMIGGIMSFISCASFYYIDELKLSAFEYSIFQGTIMVTNCFSSYASGRLMERLGLRGVLRTGLSMFAIGAVIFLLISFINPTSPVLITAAVSLFAGGVGFVFASISAEAMSVFPENTGAAGSMITLVRGNIIAVLTYATGVVYNGQVLTIALSLFAIFLTVMILYRVMQRSVSSFSQAGCSGPSDLIKIQNQQNSYPDLD